MEVLKSLESKSVNTCVTSPPYFGLRDYGMKGQFGMEETPDEYVQNLVSLFREVRRVLRDDGTLWLNLGDSYAGSGRGRDADGEWNPGKGGSKQSTNKGAIAGRKVNKLSLSKNLIKKGAIGNAWVKPPPGFKQKDLIGIPWRVAFALQADGWYLRQDIIWSKPNPMPESVTDRCTKAHEYIFLLSKSPKYYFDADEIKERAIYGLNGEDHRPAGIVRNREYDYDSKINNNPAAYMVRGSTATLGDKNSARRDARAGKGRFAYKGKRTQDSTGKNGQQSFVSIPERRNKRSVWTVSTKPYKDAHFATFPMDLIKPCVLAGSPMGGVCLDPFMGSGTTAVVSMIIGRQYIGIELNPKYVKIAEARIKEYERTCA